METDGVDPSVVKVFAAAKAAGLAVVGPEWQDSPGGPRLGHVSPTPDPLYCLPERAIDRFRRPCGRIAAQLDEGAVAAERALLALCRRHHAVGFSGRRPIVYPHLSVSRQPSFLETFPDRRWSKEELRAIEAYEGPGRSMNLRAKGYVGWLRTEPPFLESVGVLEAGWRALPERDRPDFPLRRPTPPLTSPPGAPARPASESAARFATELETFLDRWGLIGLASWDLPEPQGPLIPSSLPPGAPALPRHGLHIVLPLHYPLTGDDKLLDQIRSLQRQMAGDLGLDRTSAGLPHHKAYAQILEIVHWESVISGRFPSARRAKDFVRLMVEAIGEAIGLEVDQVSKWRKHISASRRGLRASIPGLRVAD